MRAAAILNFGLTSFLVTRSIF